MPVAAPPVPFIDFGNTAWVLISTALVLFMTIPALALFYGGLVRRKNILSVMMQCFISMAVISLIWVAFGYSLAFGPGHGALAGIIGGFDWAFLKNVGMEPSPYYISQSTARIPHIAFMIFQMMFAVITPALIIGAFAERIKFSAFLVFTVLWSVLIYSPIAHMVWSADGIFFKMGALDFAGGTVVHINAGFAALAAAIIIGKRKSKKAAPPHNLVYTAIGAAMLWFGWFGFNAGSALAADGLAASAFLATHIATAAAAVMWGLLDWLLHKKPTMLGVATGAVAGLVAITPAAGFVDIMGAMAIGFSVSVVCYFFVVVIKPFFGYDDALDAFGVHGIGGLWGALLTGVFATPVIQSAYKGLLYGNPNQLKVQALVSLTSIVITFFGSLILLKLIDMVMGLRVTEKDEAIGLDVSSHNERAYTLVE